MKGTTTRDATNTSESVYTVEELVANAKALGGATPAEVLVALQQAGSHSVTLTEAKRIVDTFRKKEV